MTDCIQRQDFDTEAFGIPFFRVRSFNQLQLEEELASLIVRRPLIIDAKVPADLVDIGRLLQRYGFRKVCTQIELTREIAARNGGNSEVSIQDKMELSEDVVRAHARNFLYSRFRLDPKLPREGAERLYCNWIRNSISGGSKKVVCLGNNFCTFAEMPDVTRIDLVSVLDKRQGVASALLSALFEHGYENHRRLIEVVTECENKPAWQLYLKNGFTLIRFYSAFHFVSI